MAVPEEKTRMKTPPTIEAAVARLKLIALETTTPQKLKTRRLSPEDRYAIQRVMDEMHRLHLVITRETAKTRKLEKKRPANRRRSHDLKRQRPTTPAKKQVTPK
jgi:hypothetical protein